MVKYKHLDNVLVYSDPHWGHKNIVKYCNRPATYNRIMFNQYLDDLNNLDSNKEYTLICLGDVYFTTDLQENGLNWFTAFNGAIPSNITKKILIKGNHDQQAKLNIIGNMFDAVLDVMILDDIKLSHYPSPTSPIDFAYTVHGHQHNSTQGDYVNKNILISPEWLNYHIVSLYDVLKGEGKTPYWNKEENKMRFFEIPNE